jgi:hypothetical protein
MHFIAIVQTLKCITQMYYPVEVSLRLTATLYRITYCTLALGYRLKTPSVSLYAIWEAEWNDIVCYRELGKVEDGNTHRGNTPIVSSNHSTSFTRRGKLSEATPVTVAYVAATCPVPPPLRRMPPQAHPTTRCCARPHQKPLT